MTNLKTQQHSKIHLLIKTHRGHHLIKNLLLLLKWIDFFSLLTPFYYCYTEINLSNKSQLSEDKSNIWAARLPTQLGTPIEVLMSGGRLGTFHPKHGSNIRLLEDGTVAHRIDSYNKAVVYTQQPINLGSMYKVKLLDKGGGWAGSIVSHTTPTWPAVTRTSFQRFGLTTESPDEIEVPSGALDLYRSSNYWILSASTVHSSGQEKRVDFNLESLRVGQTVGCRVTKDGDLHYYIDDDDKGIGWSGLPTDKPMWGFADIYGLARKIKSEFVFGKFQ